MSTRPDPDQRGTHAKREREHQDVEVRARNAFVASENTPSVVGRNMAWLHQVYFTLVSSEQNKAEQGREYVDSDFVGLH